MRILLTNDDGFEAEGLQCLYEVLSKRADCFVVAPDQGRSCCGHAVTTSSQLDIVRRNENSWAISGTPADCVRVGLLWLQLKPDLVISGVNHGGNLGVDIIYSGTVAAAREAYLLGVPSIAISQYMRRDVERDWKVNAMRAVHVIDQVLQWNDPTVGFWSVNLPALPVSDLGFTFPIIRCEPERQSLFYTFDGNSAQNEDTHSVMYKSNYQLRPREVGSDVDLCFGGHATVSRLGV